MRAQIAALLGASEDRVNLKVTSTDGLGALGREEGIAALAVVLLESKADDPGDGPALGSVDRSGTR
jgi:2-C-methyl-D-erythritol 2,4-cyclodiphosphate synthase